MKKISILGCGWLGFPLAKFLIKKGFEVKGSTTSLDKITLLLENGIEAYSVILNPDLRTKNFDKFLESDLLIIDIPPGRVDDKVVYHKTQMEEILSHIKKSQINKVIYISSTSIYGEDCGIVSEDDETIPISDGGRAVKEAEKILSNSLENSLAILRFAGLIGPERHPGRFLSFKNNFEDGNRPVNLIHQVDCINIIYEVINQNKFGEIFNGSSSKHPTKEKFYSYAAENLGIPKPSFIKAEERDFKIVSNKKVKNVLNYKFVYDDPFEMLKAKI